MLVSVNTSYYYETQVIMGAKFIPTQKALRSQRGNVEKRVFTAEEGGLFSLEQWFSTGRDFAPKGTFGNVWRHFGSSKWGGGDGGY